MKLNPGAGRTLTRLEDLDAVLVSIGSDPFEVAQQRLKVAGNISMTSALNPRRFLVNVGSDTGSRLETDWPDNIGGISEISLRWGRNTWPSNIRHSLFQGSAYTPGLPPVFTAALAHEFNTQAPGVSGYRPSTICCQGQQLVIGGASPTGGTTGLALVELVSTTKGFLGCRMTTTQRDAQTGWPEGMEIYNLTLHKKQIRTASAWETVTSA